MIRDCLRNTTAHGFPQLVNPDNNKISKSLWTLITMVALTLFLWHSSSLIEKYIRRDTAVSVNLRGAQFVYPDVYICRMAFWSNILLNYYFNQNDSDFRNLSDFVNGDEAKLYKLITDKDHPLFSNLIIDKLMKNTNFSDFLGEIRIHNFSKKAEEIFERVPNSIYHSCYKLKENYKYVLFKFPIVLNLFVDYQWYRNENSTNNLMNDNITFTLRTQNDVTATSHVVFIIPKDEYPHLTSFHFPLKRGHHTYYYATMERHNMENSDKKPCLRNHKKIEYLNYLNHTSPVSYKATPFDCEIKLFQKDHLSTKNCFNPILPIPYDLWKPGFTNYCRTSPEGSYAELTDIGKQIQQNEQRYNTCNKESACDTLVYTGSIYNTLIDKSMAETFTKIAFKNYPHMYRDFYNYVTKKKATIDEELDKRESLQNSFTSVMLIVYQYNSRLYEEKFSYEIITLLSDIGGILGFYMGVSIITLLEIIAFIGKYFPRKEVKTEDNLSLQHRPKTKQIVT